MFCNLRRSVKSLKKFTCQEPSFAIDIAFSDLLREEFSALHAKEFCDPSEQTRTHVSAILQAQPGLNDETKRNWAVKSALDRSARPGYQIETPRYQTQTYYFPEIVNTHYIRLTRNRFRGETQLTPSGCVTDVYSRQRKHENRDKIYSFCVFLSYSDFNSCLLYIKNTLLLRICSKKMYLTS